MPAKHPILIFADGASSGNPGPGGWGAIVVLPEGQVVELGGGEPQTTNNRMEMMAALRALESVRDRTEPVEVYTDSVYLIKGITEWIWAWRKRGWKTAEGEDVANTELWKALSGALGRRGREAPVDWRYVRGHSGVPGNERVDEIAVAFTKGRRPSLYRGPLLQYGVPVHDIPDDTSVPELKRREKAAPAYSYLSLVNGVLRRHATWPECEAVVKGRPGAKFKKAATAEDEARILAEWGYEPADL